MEDPIGSTGDGAIPHRPADDGRVAEPDHKMTAAAIWFKRNTLLSNPLESDPQALWVLEDGSLWDASVGTAAVYDENGRWALDDEDAIGSRLGPGRSPKRRCIDRGPGSDCSGSRDPLQQLTPPSVAAGFQATTMFLTTPRTASASSPTPPRMTSAAAARPAGWDAGSRNGARSDSSGLSDPPSSNTDESDGDAACSRVDLTREADGAAKGGLDEQARTVMDEYRHILRRNFQAPDTKMGSNAMAALLELLNPDVARIFVLDSSWHLGREIRAPPTLKASHTLITTSICHSDHWVACCIDRERGVAEIMDSAHGAGSAFAKTTMAKARAVADAVDSGLADRLEFRQIEQRGWRQRDDVSCGFWALSYQLFKMNDVEMPSSLDIRMCRLAFATILNACLDPVGRVDVFGSATLATHPTIDLDPPDTSALDCDGLNKWSDGKLEEMYTAFWPIKRELETLYCISACLDRVLYNHEQFLAFIDRNCRGYAKRFGVILPQFGVTPRLQNAARELRELAAAREEVRAGVDTAAEKIHGAWRSAWSEIGERAYEERRSKASSVTSSFYTNRVL